MLQKLKYLGMLFLTMGILKAEDNSIYSKIGKTYLKSFEIHKEEPVVKNEQEELNFWQRLRKKKPVLNKEQFKRNILDEKEAKHIVFERFSTLDIKPGLVLSESLWKDLELVYGNGDDSSTNLLSILNRANSHIGQAALAKMLVTPLTDIKELKKRRNTIKEIATNEELFNVIDSLLNNMASAEERVLFFWKDFDKMTQNFLKKPFFKSNILKTVNQSPKAMEAMVRLRQLGTPLAITWPYFAAVYGVPAGHMALKEFWRNKINNAFNSKTYVYSDETTILGRIIRAFEAYRSCQIVVDNDKEADIVEKFLTEVLEFPSSFKAGVANNRNNLKYLKSEVAENFSNDLQRRWKNGNKIKFMANYSLSVSFYAIIVYYFYIRSIKNSIIEDIELNFISKHLQDQLIQVSSFIRTMRSTTHILSKNAVTAAMPSVQKINKFFGDKAYSDKLDQLLELLDTDTFKGESSFFSLTGRTLAAYSIMCDVKDELVEVMEAIGEVEAHFSIAKLYKEFKDEKVGYCFAQYVEADTPYIALQDFWNPFIDSKVVVSNSIALGNGFGANAIITGPNAGGKSTVLKAVSLSILLAQSFGIVPAKEAVITPFSKINTHLNIQDDISANNSLFKAEVLRSQSLVKIVKALKAKEFSFTIMDEMFNGTSPKEGTAASYTVSKSLAKYGNSMSLLATHFHKLTDLEKDTNGLFKNYKVSVIKHTNGRLEYPFRLLEGITDQNIAFDILAQEGVLDGSELLEAQGIMESIK